MVTIPERNRSSSRFSLVFAAEWLWPKSRAVVVLRYAGIAAVILPIVGAAVFGFVAGMRGARTH